MDVRTVAPGKARFSFPPIRAGVSLLFLMNGFLVGAWAPKIPEFAERLGLSKSQLGLMILLIGVGSLCLMPVAGALMAARGSEKVVKVMAVLMVPSLFLLTMTDQVWTAAIAVIWFGGFMGAMDVAMNTNAVAVERRMGSAIMSSCHAFWSLGGLVGSATGGLMISWFGVTAHAVAATLAAAGVLAIAWPMVLADAPEQHDDAPKRRLPLEPLPWIFGMMALFSMVPEGAVLDWGAFYIRQELGASLAASGFAFAAFSGTMALMRFSGDIVRNRFGAVKTMRISAVFAIIGMLCAGLAPSSALAIAGFALCGLGIANMVPIAFSAAGNIPGLAPGVGMSVATTMGYSGLLVAPSLIGFTAEHVGFQPVFLFLPILLLTVLLLSRLVKHADRIHQ